MLKTSAAVKKKIAKIVQEAVQELFGLESVVFTVDYAKEEQFGDYATNIALVLAKKVGKSPMEIAKKLKDQLLKLEAVEFGKIEVATPGYINFYLTEGYLQHKVVEIQTQGVEFGNNDYGKGKSVQIEFISSNPTGPIHLGNGRGGPTGDSLANVLKKSGYAVEKEFYVNDFGNQVDVLGHSVLKDEQAQYSGDYIADLVENKPKELNDSMEVGVWAANIILQKYIKPACENLGIFFDSWFSEKSLHMDGKIDEIIATLKEKDLTYEKEGALWFKSTEFGDDKDRVIIKTNGKKTYVVNDFAYHKNKLERGFDKLINIQGSDHHKEAEVVKNFIEKVLGQENKIDYILSQFVRVVKDGKEVKMSKRRGVYFALDDLTEEVGSDAVRFIFTSYAPTSHINFDINLAKERSEKNPVFYVQYAHARICSILRKAEESGVGSATTTGDGNPALLVHEKEMSLIKELNKFPELVAEVSATYEVHKLPYYAIKLADKFHSFYNACKVIDAENPELTKARIGLITAVQIVLGETLNLIGVEAPEKM